VVVGSAVWAAFLVAGATQAAEALPPGAEPAQSSEPHDRALSLDCAGKRLDLVFAQIEERCGLTFCYEDYCESEEEEKAGSTMLGPRVEAHLSAPSVSQALEMLRRSLGGFEWRRDRNVVNIIDTRCTGVPDYPFDEQLASVRFRGTWLDLRRHLHDLSPRYRQDTFTLYGWEMWAKHWPVAVDMQDVTLRTFLNRVCQLTGCHWRAKYRAWDGTFAVDVRRAEREIPSEFVVLWRSAGDRVPDGKPTQAPSGWNAGWTAPALVLLGAVLGLAAGVLIGLVKARRGA